MTVRKTTKNEWLTNNHSLRKNTFIIGRRSWYNSRDHSTQTHGKRDLNNNTHSHLPFDLWKHRRKQNVDRKVNPGDASSERNWNKIIQRKRWIHFTQCSRKRNRYTYNCLLTSSHHLSFCESKSECHRGPVFTRSSNAYPWNTDSNVVDLSTEN